MACAKVNLAFDDYDCGQINNNQLGKALVKAWGQDSVAVMIENGGKIFLTLDVDSLGYVNKIVDGFIKYSKRDGSRRSVHLGKSELNMIEEVLTGNGYQFTGFFDITAVPYEGGGMKEYVRRILKLIDSEHCCLAPVMFPVVLDKDALIGGHKYLDRLHGTLLWPPRYVIAPVDSVTGLRQNEALLLISMIYCFGEVRLNDWIDEYDFVLSITLDKHNDIENVDVCHGEIPPMDRFFDVLKKFWNLNGVKLGYEPSAVNDACNRENIVVRFPGEKLRRMLESDNYLWRMNKLTRLLIGNF